METEPNCELTLPASPPEAHYTVYKLTDPEGKVYIGCTGKPVEQRWKKGNHYNRSTPIWKAIFFYGWEKFSKEILCEKLIKEGAEELEKWFIAYYDSSDPAKGYNRFLGGLGKGSRMSEVTRKVCRERKNTLYEEHPEIAEQIRKSVIGLFESDPDYKKRIAAGVMKAYEKDPTYKVRLSEKTKELWKNPEYRERCSSSRRRASENPDLAMKQRQTRKSILEEHPEIRENISRRMQAYFANPGEKPFLTCDRHPKPVICIETGVSYPSQKAAERATGFRNIYKACAGKQNTAGGYHWRYAVEQEMPEEKRQ